MIEPHQTRTVEALVEAVAGGARPKFLCFWGHTPHGSQAVGPWVLSQWLESPFEVDGATYRTAEHWMMAGKATLFGDGATRDQILSARTPGEAKALGRRVRGFQEAAWQAHRMALVVEGNVHKFSQHPALGEYLRSTARRVLVEASPVDRVWGIGLAADHPDATQPQAWRGLNLLGFALMEARARL